MTPKTFKLVSILLNDYDKNPEHHGLVILKVSEYYEEAKLLVDVGLARWGGLTDEEYPFINFRATKTLLDQREKYRAQLSGE